MKKFLKKRWHSIPVGIISALLAVCLVAGGAFAAYNFLTADLQVDVEEAIVVGIWNPGDPAHSGWDNLEPYGSVGDVEITLGGTETVPVISITTIPGYAGDGFVAGEWIVIPVNLRNAGDGELNLEASVTGGGGNLALEYDWETNNGPATSTESGQEMCREWKAHGDDWAPLGGWSATIAGHGGKSGSAVVGAKVLFVKVSAPGDAIPGTYTFNVYLSRS